MQLATVIPFSGFNEINQADLRGTKKPEANKTSSRREQAVRIFFALYQTYVRVRDQLLGSTPLLSKCCPFVLEVKIEEPLLFTALLVSLD